jgi:hypothetical protein
LSAPGAGWYFTGPICTTFCSRPGRTICRGSYPNVSPRRLTVSLEIDATFVSVQKEVHPADAVAMGERGDIVDAAPVLGDFATTAGLLSELDLLITVDTRVAHLAGALGRPVWLMVSYIPDWRWLLDRDSSPWYPAARLFRLDETRTWGGVVERIREALGQWIEI